jgi:uncharacterized protein (TIGR03435 family)
VGVLAALALGATLAAQTRPEFEVASIRPSTAPRDRVGVAAVGLHVDGSQVRISGLSLREYVITAYGLPPQQISSPDWLGEARFDLAAKIPDGVPATEVREMLQSLLADRFKMTVHHETKELPVYALVVAPDGPKLTAAAAAADAPAASQPGVNVSAGGADLGASADLGGGSSFTLANDRIQMRRMTAPAMARLLTRLADRPVVDATGLSGTYDIDLQLSPDQYRAVLVRAAVNNGTALPPRALRLLDLAGGDPVADALDQVGLSLDPRKAPLDTLVIDSIQKTPTDN